MFFRSAARKPHIAILRRALQFITAPAFQGNPPTIFGDGEHRANFHLLSTTVVEPTCLACTAPSRRPVEFFNVGNRWERQDLNQTFFELLWPHYLQA